MSEATVAKSVMERYAVRNGGEWATICVREFVSSVPTDGRAPYFGGEILINSSFGSWANTWTACGSSFKKFLTDIDFDYAFGKFMGASLRVYDGEATVTALRREVIEDRRSGSLDKAEARAIWDAIEDCESDLTASVDSFVHAMWNMGRSLNMNDRFCEPWHMTHDRYDNQAKGFWRDIWPAFRAELQRETQKVAA